jgi:hypothetical protein
MVKSFSINGSWMDTILVLILSDGSFCFYKNNQIKKKDISIYDIHDMDGSTIDFLDQE